MADGTTASRPLKRAALAAMAAAILSACGNGYSYTLRDPKSGAEASCVTPWAFPSSEDSQRLWSCVEACEAKGFFLERPETMPARPMVVSDTKPFWIPLACQ